MSVQLLMPGIVWQLHATFASFYPGQNAAAIASLQAALQGDADNFLFLWGPPGAGRSHLLQASCHLATDAKKNAIYLPLTTCNNAKPELSPSVFEDLEQLDVICLDDIDTIAGQRPWEEAIFHLYNRLHAAQCTLIVASQKRPNELPWHLPDLASRLSACTPYYIHPLTDEEKLAALQHSAHHRGFTLPEEVAQFLLRRYSREVSDLFQALEQLDHASLTDHRRLTVPFAKGILGL